MTSISFFLPGDADEAYCNIRDKTTGPAPEARAFIESLWRRYRGLEDHNFLTDAKTHFLQRFWEMYLAVTFMERGLKPSRKGRGGGPEFSCSYKERKIWVEAVAPGPGDSAADRVEEASTEGVTDLPEEKILLRLTQALAQKRERYLAALAKGIVSDQDCYVLGVNSKGITQAYGALPFFFKALLPIGDPLLRIRATAKITDSYYTLRETITKARGSPVSTTAFLDPQFAFLSAVIHSRVDCLNRPEELGEDFMVLHNPLAARPLEPSVFKWCEQYVYNDGELTIQAG